MDINKLYEYLEKDFLTDVTILLSDEKQIIKKSFHKNILSSSCPYFEKLFSNHFREKDSKEIEIHVPSASVCYDIILSFYDQEIDVSNFSKYKYILETIRCKDFLGLKIGTDEIARLKKLQRTKVLEEDFGLLLEVASLFQYDGLVKMIKDNLPNNYDLNKLDKSLVKKMVDNNEFIILSENKFIRFYDLESWTPIKTLSGNQYITYLNISSDRQKLISKDCLGNVKIWDIQSGNELSSIKDTMFDDDCDPCHGRCYCITNDMKKMVLLEGDYDIKICDLESGIVQTIIGDDSSGYVKSACLTHDNKKLVAVYNNRCIKIWNLETGATNSFGNEKIDNHKHSYRDYFHNYINVSLDDKLIISNIGGCNVGVWEMESGKLLYVIDPENPPDNHINCICLGPNNKLITGSKNGSIGIWDLYTGKYLSQIHEHGNAIKEIQISYDGHRIIVLNNSNITIWNINSGSHVKTISLGLGVHYHHIFSIPYNNQLVENLKLVSN